MLTRITRRRVSGKNVRELPLLNCLKKECVVWWYGGISKNFRAETVPTVAVFFREVDSEGALGKFIRVDMGLTHLGLLRLGSIWRDGTTRWEVDALKTEDFDVDYGTGEWKFVSPWEDKQKGLPNTISQEDYPLRFPDDKNYLVDFPLENGKNLLVPCLEFFTRFYGHSADVRRVLATFPWAIAKERLFAPLDAPVTAGRWPVKLRRKLSRYDAAFLAHVLYDDYARGAAKSIYSQLESFFRDHHRIAFLKAGPWFQGWNQIRVKGLWVNSGRTFLGLQVIGGGDPEGNTILRYLDTHDGAVTGVEGDAADVECGSGPAWVLYKKPEIVDLTEESEPDYGSGIAEVEEPDFVILGPPRCVINVKVRTAEAAAIGHYREGRESHAFASGDPYGSGKGIGRASIHSTAAMESHGVLRDMWDALLYLQAANPDVVQQVAWFTFQDGWSADPEPHLIALQPFTVSESGISTKTRHWVYYDRMGKVPRGVLVAQVVAGERKVQIVEIQRRSRNKAEGGEGPEEECFKGFAFVLDDQALFEEWLRELLSDIRHVEGVVQKLVGKCPGKAVVFNHSHAKHEERPHLAAALNALSKFGVKG